MPALYQLVSRRDAETKTEVVSSDNLVNLLIALMAILFFALLLVAALFIIRRSRRQQQQDQHHQQIAASAPPKYSDIKRTSNHRRLTIQTSSHQSSIYVFNKDDQPMLSNPNSPPDSPDNVPQIRITFPDEQDAQGRRKSGRVVVVRVGETSVGLEPVMDQPPAYEKETSSGFHSIDMDQIGGLKEKDRSEFV